jgi:hypothetical protein
MMATAAFDAVRFFALNPAEAGVGVDIFRAKTCQMSAGKA